MKWRVFRNRGDGWRLISEHAFEEEARTAYAFALSEIHQGGVRLVTPEGAIKASFWRGPRETASASA